MTEFLYAVVQMPTAIFSLLLVAVVFYWTLIIVGALELDLLDADVDVGDTGGAADTLVALGMRGVPIPVWLSIFATSAWLLSIMTMSLAGDALVAIAGTTTVAIVVALVSAVVATAITSLAVRPLFPLFEVHPAIEHRALVGKPCTITTLRVDDGFGQALVDDGAAGLLVQVRCQDATELSRGARALIFDYDPEEGTFHVARFDDPAADSHP